MHYNSTIERICGFQNWILEVINKRTCQVIVTYIKLWFLFHTILMLSSVAFVVKKPNV